MRDNISPEERLLKLIRGQKKQNNKTIDKEPSTAFAVADVQPPIKYSAHPSAIRYLSPLDIRKIIFLIFGASCIYLIISFIYPLVGFKENKLPQIKQENTSETEREPEQKSKPYEFYLEGIKNRQIFGSTATAAPVQEKEKPVVISAESADLIKNINLVGIIAGENAQAVIEDKKIQKTYYLTKGQFMGEFQVEDIQDGKVILNYNGQRLELYL